MLLEGWYNLQNHYTSIQCYHLENRKAEAFQ